MKALKNITTKSKGMTTLCMVLFFLFASVAKGFAYRLPVNMAADKKAPAKTWLTVSVKQTTPEVLNQLPDTDGDDSDLVLFYNFTTPNTTTRQSNSPQNNRNAALYSDNYHVPLYDLYCNWKYHL
ncbi:hypothetical protein ACLI1A_18215 [Flavobacterium sp. RHBU_3]|uniref:hypothetical protein n=1 Tax=Flavobacterium sp. RHBU_3 TaxID=3391184 RepID=UPI0039853434